MEILIGTNNKNKLKQFRDIFSILDSSFNVYSLSDFRILKEVEEDKEDLLENAKKKAEFYGEISKIPTLADDTGLFIDALKGEPGVHSKRWLLGSDEDRYLKVLEKMKNVPPKKRTCKYRGSLVFYNPLVKKDWTYLEDLKGEIAFNPKKGNGFGYDPIVKIDGKYYSEFTEEERAKVSHRGRGVKALISYLKVKYN